MIDIKFIQFYASSFHNKTIEEYFHVKKSTVSNWRKRGMPDKYLKIFIDIEGSNNIHELIDRIYLKNKKENLIPAEIYYNQIIDLINKIDNILSKNGSNNLLNECKIFLIKLSNQLKGENKYIYVNGNGWKGSHIEELKIWQLVIDNFS